MRSKAARFRRLALIALSLVAVLVGSACGGGGNGEGGEGYPDDAVSNFMASCEPSAVESSQGALTAEEARNVCRCVIDELQQTLPFEDFREYDARADERPADPPAEVTAALENCTESLGTGE
jgi:hypothetical protein